MVGLIALVLAAVFTVLLFRTGVAGELWMRLAHDPVPELGGRRKRLSDTALFELEHQTLEPRSVEEWGHGNACIKCWKPPKPRAGSAGVSKAQANTITSGTIHAHNLISGTFRQRPCKHQYVLGSYDCIYCGEPDDDYAYDAADARSRRAATGDLGPN